MPPAPTDTPGLPAAIAETPPPLVTNCADIKQRGVARPSVRRLTRTEIVATLGELWNGLWQVDKELSAYGDLLEMHDVAKFDQLHTFEQAMQWTLVVDAMAQKMGRTGGGSCFTQATITDACWTDFFTTFGRRVFRRPLTAGEVTGLVASVQGVPTADAVYRAHSLLFRAPDFLFHIEQAGAPDGAHARLTSHEVANRISYATIGSMPDKPLADAADRGELQTMAQVEPHVRRLIELPRAKEKLKVFFAEWLHASGFARPDFGYVKDRLGLGNGHSVQQELTTELLDFALHVIWTEKGTFNDLMTSKVAFPRNADVQKIFEAPSSLGKDGTMPVAVPNHAGLAVRPAMMLNAGWETSPILRGAFVRRRILCDELTSPDFSVISARFEEIGALDPKLKPNHAITTEMTSAPDCMACHKDINPLGFMYEGFNSVGMKRTEQVVWKDFYTVSARHPIPSPITGVNIEPGLPTTFDSPLKLAAALGTSKKARACSTKYLFRHLQRRAETQADSCALAEASRVLDDGKPVLDMFVKSIANEDVFWRRAP